ncbi:MAG: T9SS type A sorting domain-containing protein [Bacteroidia bacterium]|nr:T9SS type A sorting domain-containing protein [Bacteroidia bacterium]
MKYIKLLVLVIMSFTLSQVTYGQIEDVIVEKYYISDANDATDTTEFRSVAVGSVTYRIYVDLKEGSRIRKIYGDTYHALKIESTQDFYNNIDRPNANFGYLINKTWLDDNPTLALDSWITLGLGAIGQAGVLKPSDTDGSFLFPNNGGTYGVPGGLLLNNNPDAGITLNNADGYVTNTSTYGQWVDFGFEDIAGDDTTVFGAINTGNSFVSNDIYLQQNAGVMGFDTVSNIVLVAQLTTTGDLSFELNFEIEEINGGSTNIVKYVASNDTLLPGEVVSPFLKYPSVCGCTDPDYLEYNSSFACSDAAQCLTPVVFGCMDTLACNYDSQANFSIPSLCCYPGLCNDRNLTLVCPDISNGRFGIMETAPNPASESVSFSIFMDTQKSGSLKIFDVFGKLIYKEELTGTSAVQNRKVDLNEFANGVYIVHLLSGNDVSSTRFIKNSN